MNSINTRQGVQNDRRSSHGRNADLIEAPVGDARFFARSGPHALADIARAAVGTAPAIQRMFAGVAPLQSAGQDEVSFLDNRRYVAALERTLAGAVIVHPQMQARVPS